MNKFIKDIFLASVFIVTVFHSFAEGGTFEMVAGWEGYDKQGYSFLSPSYSMAMGKNQFVVLRASVNHLYYEFDDTAGETKVRSPGADVGVSFRWSRDRLSLSLGPGYEVRQTERTFADGEIREEVEEGFNFLGSLFFQATPQTNLYLMSSYSDSNSYIWSRAGVKRQVTNMRFEGSSALFLGAEITGQGNDETSDYQGGLLVETAFFRKQISFQLRAGYSIENSQPYFGVGMYKSF